MIYAVAQRKVFTFYVCSLCRKPLSTDDHICPGCGATIVNWPMEKGEEVAQEGAGDGIHRGTGGDRAS